MTQTEVKATELAWLAGMIDGEGSVTIFKHQEKGGQIKLCPTIIITNTHEETIATCLNILDRLGTSFHVFERKPKNPKKHKKSIQISTRNMRYIKIVLQAVLPYLVTKKAQAQMTLRYVTKNLERRETGKNRYDEEDFALQSKVQGMNKHGPISEPSETVGEQSHSDYETVQTATT